MFVGQFQHLLRDIHQLVVIELELVKNLRFEFEIYMLGLHLLFVVLVIVITLEYLLLKLEIRLEVVLIDLLLYLKRSSWPVSVLYPWKTVRLQA